MEGGANNRSRLVFVGLILAAAVAALVFALAGGEDKGPGNAVGNCVPDSPAATAIKLPCPPDTGPPPSGTTATVSTSEGDFTIALDTEQAPVTTASFVYMADQGAYKDTSFTRIAPDFVIQGGDPTGTQAGNAGYTVTEAPPADLQYTKGTVAMAKGGAEAPGASGSQFFVVIGSGGSSLPPDYALLGTISGGEDVVQKIAAIGTATGSDGPPKRPVKIDNVTINPVVAA